MDVVTICNSCTGSAFQILFISGVTLTIGTKSAIQFFMKRRNFMVYTFNEIHLFVKFPFSFVNFIIEQGTISFGVGFFVVLIGWLILGMILEAYGFVVLLRFVLCFRKLFGNAHFNNAN